MKRKIIICTILFFIISLMFNSKIIQASTGINIVSGKVNELNVGEEAKIEVVPDKSYSGYSRITTYKISSDIIEVKETASGTKYTITGIKHGKATITISTTYYSRGGTAAKDEIDLEVNVVDPEYLEENAAQELEKNLRDEFGTGYNEVILRDYTADEMVKLIVERSYGTGYTNHDSGKSELRLIDPQFNYNSKVSWDKNEIHDYAEIKDLKLKCINSTDHTYWNKGEEWKFNYSFYYIKELNKLIFIYSQTLTKDADGEIFNDSKQSEERYNNRVIGAESKIGALYAMVTGEDRDSITFTDVLNDIENYIPTEEDPPAEFISMASIVLTTITNVGMVISILMVAIIGLKYMLGSVEEKAEYKKDMIPYLVGAGLLFGITAIVKILQQWGESINNI